MTWISKQQNDRPGPRPPVGARLFPGSRVARGMLTLAAALLVTPVFGQGGHSGLEEHAHEHEPLAADPTLTLSAVVDATYRRYPTLAELEARDLQARSWLDRSRSWTANRPVVSFRYQTDRWGDDAGLEEFETGIQLSLWKWGERSSTRMLGQAYSAETRAAESSVRWEIAGTLREIVWEIARAEREIILVEQAHAIASRLASAIRRRYELGDVALGDVLLAETAELETETLVIGAASALVDAERAYRLLTGLESRPTFLPETLSSKTGIDTDHPALALAGMQVARARAEQERIRRSAMTHPTVTIGPRRERGAVGAPFEESIGVVLAVPFGGNAHVRSSVTDAGRAVGEAVSAEQRITRELDLALHEASHGLSVARKNLVTARQRSNLAARRYAMGESAYRKGELELIELLTLQRVAIDAERQVLEYEIGTSRQTAMYNQAVGVLP